jgi:hypothetical protein
VAAPTRRAPDPASRAVRSEPPDRHVRGRRSPDMTPDPPGPLPRPHGSVRSGHLHLIRHENSPNERTRTQFGALTGHLSPDLRTRARCSTSPSIRAWPDRHGRCSFVSYQLLARRCRLVTSSGLEKRPAQYPASLSLHPRDFGHSRSGGREGGRRARAGGAGLHPGAEQNLWHAIDSRNVFGQAQGMLMQRFGLSAEKAFGVLRR